MDDLVIEIASGLVVGAGMGLVGAGGAIFTVPIFGIVLGHEPKAAFIEALAVTGGIALVSGLIAARRGLVDWRCVLIFGSAGIVGTQLATPIAVRMNPTVQVLLFALVAVVAAWRMWKSGRDTEAPEDVRPATDPNAPVEPGVVAGGAADSLLVRESSRGWPVRSLVIGTGIGALTAILGVGGGFILIPALVMVERMPMRIAVGTSLTVIVINATAGLLGQWWSGGSAQVHVDVATVAITIAGGIVGSLFGGALARRIPPSVLRSMFALLLVIAGLGLAAKHLLTAA